jgi:GT2 family glycosyltransferase
MNQKQPQILLSIIIVNFETPDYTIECIRSIIANPSGDEFEIIVIDNGSRDKSLGMIREAFPEVICIETGTNLGFSKANNLGIHNSHGDFILLLNSDTKITGDILQAMLDYLEFHPEIGILGPRQVDGEGNFTPSCDHFPTFFSEICRKIVHYRLSLNDYRLRDYMDEQHSNRSAVDWVSGSCLMVRRSALLDAGLLDEQFFMYFEDIDFSRRVQKSGWKIEYFPSQTIVHYGGQSARLNILNVMVENRKSQLYFSRKYFGWWGHVMIRLLLLAKYGVNFIRWSSVLLLASAVGKNVRYSYTMVLLAKKVIEVSLQPVPKKPTVPKLQVAAREPEVPLTVQGD